MILFQDTLKKKFDIFNKKEKIVTNIDYMNFTNFGRIIFFNCVEVVWDILSFLKS